jgi:integrase
MGIRRSNAPDSARNPVQLRDAVDRFLDECRVRIANKDLSPATVNRGYAPSLEKVLLPFAARLGLVTVDQLTPDILNGLAAELHAPARKLSRASVATYLRNINQFLSWHGIKDSRLKAPMPKRRKVVREVLTPTEMRELEAAATDVRDQLIIAILAETAMREGELAGLRLRNVVDQGKRVFLHVDGKTDERMVPIPATHERLRFYIKHQRPRSRGDRLFLHKRKKDGDWPALTEGGVYQMVKDVAARTGWSKRVYPHLLRHSAMTRMGAEKLNPAYISQITGASIEVIVKNYMHPSTDDLYDAMVRARRPADDD